MRKTRRITALMLALLMLFTCLPAFAEEDEVFGEAPEVFTDTLTEEVPVVSDDIFVMTETPTAEPTAEPTAKPTAVPTEKPTPQTTEAPTPDPLVEKTAFAAGLARIGQGVKLYEHNGLWGNYAQTAIGGVVYASEMNDEETAIRITLNNGISLYEGWVKAEAVTMLTEKETASWDKEERDEDIVRTTRGHELIPIGLIHSTPTATPEPVTEYEELVDAPVVEMNPDDLDDASVLDKLIASVTKPTEAPEKEESSAPIEEEDEDVFGSEAIEATQAPLPEPSFEPEDTAEMDKFVEYRTMSAPGNLKATHNRVGVMTITWDGTEDADAYQLLYKAAHETEYSLLHQTTGTSYTTDALDPSVVYYFRVQSVELDDAGEIINQSPQSASYPYIVLGDAKIKDPRGKDTSTIRLEWNAVPGATHYDVMMSLHGKEEWSIVRTDIEGDLCDIRDLSFDETYDFLVIPKRKLNNGTVITGNTSRTKMVGSPMETPSFTEYVWTEKGLELHWDAIPGASGYVIYRRAFSEPDVTNYQKLVVLEEPVTTYVDTTMEPGEVYYYFVYTFKRCEPEGWGCFSLKGSIGMGTWMEKPVISKMESLTEQGVRLEWPALTGANYYDVHISSTAGQEPSADGRVKTAYGYHSSAKVDRTYYYRIRGVRVFSNGDISYSPWSDEYSYTHVEVEPTYRALIVGNTYPNEDNYLPGCDNDAEAMKAMLSRMTGTPYAVTVKENLTDSGMINAIASTFADAQSNDVSLFYFSGHGANTPETNFHGALVGTLHTYLSVARLKEALDQIPGKKVVIIDSCHSGQMIGKSEGYSAESAFNSEVISIFASGGTVERAVTTDPAIAETDGENEVFTSEPSVIARADNNLANSGYYVITAAHSTERSVSSGLDNNGDGKIDRYFGLFTYGLCHSSGWNSAKNSAITALNGDRDANGEITLYEAYVYAKAMAQRTNPNQTAQIYPSNSAMVVWAK